MRDVRLIYASNVAKNFDPADLEDILQSARDRNDREDITGVLFFSTDYFVQCLEGSRKAVNALYNDLANDRRHTDLVIMDYEEIEERMFSSWRMAYIGPGDISEEILTAHSMGPGFDPATIDASMAKAMLILLAKHLDS